MDALSVTYYESELGWTDVASREPHALLRAHVKRYWGYVERYAAPMRRRELPLPDVVLILSFGPELRLLDARESGAMRRHTSFVAGLTEASVVTEMDGASHGMQINLTPLGAYSTLGLPMHAVANAVVALDDVLGPAADELLEALYEAPSWGARFDRLDAFFLTRLAAGARPTPSVAYSWRRLVATDGRVAVRKLAAELGCSRKHLATRFREQVGLGPKATARVLRFARAVRLIEEGTSRSWADVAVACGYYDQAHFNRDFHQFAGSTPTEFMARRMRDGLGLAPE